MDANELASIRAAIESDLMPDTCVVLEPTRTPNGFGGWTTSMGTVATYACRLDPLRGREAVAAGLQQSFHGYMLTLPHDAVVTTNGRVSVGGVSYNIISADTGKSWAATVRVVVERIG